MTYFLTPQTNSTFSRSQGLCQTAFSPRSLPEKKAREKKGVASGRIGLPRHNTGDARFYLRHHLSLHCDFRLFKASGWELTLNCVGHKTFFFSFAEFNVWNSFLNRFLLFYDINRSRMYCWCKVSNLNMEKNNYNYIFFQGSIFPDLYFSTQRTTTQPFSVSYFSTHCLQHPKKVHIFGKWTTSVAGSTVTVSPFCDIRVWIAFQHTLSRKWSKQKNQTMDCPFHSAVLLGFVTV